MNIVKLYDFDSILMLSIRRIPYPPIYRSVAVSCGDEKISRFTSAEPSLEPDLTYNVRI